MSSFSSLVRRLEDEDLPVNVDEWYSSEYIERYERFFAVLADILEYFSRDDASTSVNIPACRRLLSLLYAMSTASVVRLSMSHTQAKDMYMECPLTTLYIGVACCLLHLREHTLYTGARDFFTMEQNQIDYCMRNKLDVKLRVPIMRFSFNDVALSLLKLERSFAALDYHPDLELYIDALDLRLCELISHTNNSVMLDNPMYIAPIRELPGEFSCSTTGEYEMIVSILAVRKLLTGALPTLRADGVIRKLENDEDVKMIAHLNQVFLTVYKNVHSDDIDDDFATRYKEQMTFISEIYLFLKLNGPDTRPDHAAIVSQFRNRTYWEGIANASHKDIGQYLEYPDRNCVAFRVLFMQMGELLFQQQVHIAWTQFCLDGMQIYKMDRLAYDEFVQKTYRQPFFVQCLNDACIFYRGQLFVFGKEPRHYFHAFKEWLDIVASEFKGIVNEAYSIRPLLVYLCNDDECLRVHADESTASGHLLDDAYLSQKKIAQRKAHETFKYILTGLNTEDTIADSENTIGDIDSTGLENSAVSGWSLAFSSSSSSSSSSRRN